MTIQDYYTVEDLVESESEISHTKKEVKRSTLFATAQRIV